MKKLSSLIKELDRVFSIYIRKRDADNNGYVKCITCNKYAHWKDVDCGHFISRSQYGVRWDEKNCSAQCKFCNAFRGGEQHLFGKEIDRRWGDGTADNLQVKRRFEKRLDRFELEILINFYKDAKRTI